MEESLFQAVGITRLGLQKDVDNGLRRHDRPRVNHLGRGYYTPVLNGRQRPYDDFYIIRYSEYSYSLAIDWQLAVEQICCRRIATPPYKIGRPV